MEAKKTLLTYTGLKKLEDELENLKVVKRKEVAGKIKEAREQGDLSENAEYDAAKDEQRDIEARIEELEKILKNAEVVVEDDVDLDTINIGCTVDVYDKEFEEEIVFQLVGSTEANSLEGKISNESPVGKALLIHVYCRNHRGCSRTAFCQDKYYVKNLQRIDDRQSDHQLDLAGQHRKIDAADSLEKVYAVQISRLKKVSRNRLQRSKVEQERHSAQGNHPQPGKTNSQNGTQCCLRASKPGLRQ